jgi:hypothetical protein
MAQHGHSVLRLPPCHPELNPIEKGVKNYVASHNVTFKFSDMRKLAEQKFQTIGEEEWKTVCQHDENVEDDYLEREILVDDVQEFKPTQAKATKNFQARMMTMRMTIYMTRMFSIMMGINLTEYFNFLF